jgi:hypothetical protein
MMRILGTPNSHIMAINLSKDMKYRLIRKRGFTRVSVVIVLLEKHFRTECIKKTLCMYPSNKISFNIFPGNS